MKELEKTKRISISAVIFLLIIVIALLTYKKPKHVFSKDAKSTLKEMLGKDYVISHEGLKAMDTASFVLVDVRSSFEYNKGHLPKAINIANNEVLNDDNIQFFKSLSADKKMVVLYSESPNMALGTWMTLYQLGYENSKILAIETDYMNKVFVVNDIQLEKSAVNYAATLDSLKSKKQVIVVEPAGEKVKKETPKAVVPVEKKKKSAPEGGC